MRSAAGVVKAYHVHRRQTDLWFVPPEHRLLLIVVDWRDYMANPMAILGTVRSAGVLMGGVLAGALTFIFYCRRFGLPLWPLADAIRSALPRAHLTWVVEEPFAPLVDGHPAVDAVITTAGIAWLALAFDRAFYLDVALVYGALAFAGVVAIGLLTVSHRRLDPSLSR